MACGMGLTVRGQWAPEYGQILTPDAKSFLVALVRKFEDRRQDLLARRVVRQREIDSGKLPDFLEHTRWIRESDWKVRGPIPPDLQDRRVEITGPVDRKMIINALNSGAKVFMADFEDANSPTWTNNMEGQINLRDAIRGTIAFEDKGKRYSLNNQIATLMVRPRGWHLEEAHVLVDGRPMSGSLFDFGLYFFTNARALLNRGSTIAFYCPKLESHLEARLWNDVFVFAEEQLQLPVGSIRVTVLIETIMAAFEMDEILYELRDHSVGLNCGRWDYIFSFIKKFRNRPDFVLPDRSVVTMDKHFLKSYVELLIRTCHRRETHAMGGMAAQIPVRNDQAANAAAFEKVRKDKLREVLAGHDGTWVAHPALIPVAMTVFNEHMRTPNQIHVPRDQVRITAADLLRVPEGPRTEKGVGECVHAGIWYLEAWLHGQGAVAINHLMEDAATAEIALAQLWQWVRHRVRLDDGRVVTPDIIRAAVRNELSKIAAERRTSEPSKQAQLAASIFEKRVFDQDHWVDFVTLMAYPYIIVLKSNV